MDTRLINIGFGNIVAANRIIAIVSPDSAPIKRIIQEARDKGILIDATYGRRTRAVVITDSGHVVLSAVQPETVAHRFTSKEIVIRIPRPELAVVHAVLELSGAFSPQGQPLPPGQGVITCVLDKAASGWRILALQNTAVAPPPAAGN